MATTLIDMGLGGSGTEGGNGAGTPFVSTQVTDPNLTNLALLQQENEKNKKMVTWLAIGLGLLLVVNLTKGDGGGSDDES